MYGKYGGGCFVADRSAEERIPAICVWPRLAHHRRPLRRRAPEGALAALYAFSPCGENR